MRRLGYLLTLVLAIALGATAGFAQDGKLKIKVTPKQAYVFVDGQAIRDGNQSISLSPGKHTVVVVNYGYKISTQDVNIEAGKSTPLEVKLEAYGGNVAGPFGDDRLKAIRGRLCSPTAHARLFRRPRGRIQQRLDLAPESAAASRHAPPDRDARGQDDLVRRREGRGEQEGRRLSEQEWQQKTVDWPRGEKLKDLPRFKAGTASAQVAVAPVTGSFSVSAANINCGQTSTLNWQSTDTVDANISGIGAVQPSGNQTV